MKHFYRSKSLQRGFLSGKVMLLIVAVAIGIMVKNNTSFSPSVSGKSVAALEAEMGQPVAKERIPRPR